MAAPETHESSKHAAPSDLLEHGSFGMRLGGVFQKAGRELYVVGGSVRDAWLNRPHVDLDFATDADPETTLELVRPLAEAVWLQGTRFGTVGALIEQTNVEITTFRTERYVPSSRHPEVTFSADIETDLSRRDFTVNAMAIGLPTKRAVDPYGGREDLEAKLLRTPIDPRDSFTDDPLRMLRAFRFASELGFRIDKRALEAITELKDSITEVSAERVRDELTRLVTGKHPGRALRAADATGLTDLFLPELSALKLEQDPVQKHKDVFHHTLAVAERTPPEAKLRLAALLHDVGKPATRKIDADGVSFHLHEVVGAKMAAGRLRALRYPNDMVDTVAELIRLHHRFHTYRLGWSDSAVRRYVRDAGDLLDDLNQLVRADCTTRNPAKARRLEARMDELEARIVDLAKREAIESIRGELDGKQVMAYLGTPPGPVVGDALEFLLELRLEEGELGPEKAYQRLDRWARSQGIEPAARRVGPKPKKND